MNIFGNWKQPDVDAFNAKVAAGKPRTARQHNQAEGVGETELMSAKPDPTPLIICHIGLNPAQNIEQNAPTCSARVTNRNADRESKLHDAILGECAVRGWAVVHSRMDRRTSQAPGVPDFIIAADGGKTWWVEAKRKGGKLSPAQRDFGFLLGHNGHELHVVYSIEDFMEVIK